MVRFVLVLDLLFVVMSSGSCPQDYPTINFLYESFQCTPVYNETDDCPSSYDCSVFNQFEDKCYYNGKHYENDTMAHGVAGKVCFGCNCRDDELFNRTIFSCFEASRVPKFKLNESCVYKEGLDMCSIRDSVCPPFSECILEGETFSEGLGKFHHPKDNCTKCVCSRGEKGEGVIECRKEYCIDLISFHLAVLSKCGAFYNNRYDCCPSTWICPEDFNVYAEGQVGIHEKFSGAFCFYDQKLFNKTEKIFSRRYVVGKEMTVVCECILPPFFTCFPLDDD